MYQGECDGWIKTDISWPINPDVWEAARIELADLIEKGGTNVSESESEPEPESEQEPEPEPKPEPEEEIGGLPGFLINALLAGIVVLVVVLVYRRTVYER